MLCGGVAVCHKYGMCTMRCVECDSSHSTRRVRFACWIPKASNTNLEYVILIAFLLRQWLLHDRASMLRLNIHCVYCSI